MLVFRTVVQPQSAPPCFFPVRLPQVRHPGELREAAGSAEQALVGSAEQALVGSAEQALVGSGRAGTCR